MVDYRELANRFAAEICSFEALISNAEGASRGDLLELAAVLSALLYRGETLPDAWSENDIETPALDRNSLEEKLTRRFPDFGWYSVSPPLADDGGPSNETLTGDAIDDLAEIYLDLRDVLWRIDHGNPVGGIWYARTHFMHWGKHALELKRYIHQRLFSF